MIWYDMIWYDMVWYGMVWYGMVWYDDMIWYDMIWYEMIWYEMIWYSTIIPRSGGWLAVDIYRVAERWIFFSSGEVQLINTSGGEIVPLSYCSREERQAMRSSFARQWQKDFSCMFRDDLIGGPSWSLWHTVVRQLVILNNKARRKSQRLCSRVRQPSSFNIQ